MRTLLTLAFSGVLALGITGVAMAQDDTARPQGSSQAHQGIPHLRSVDQELDHLAKDLELTADQQKQIRPLLQEHHDKIQALMDKNPTLSRQALGPQIHAISDETHHQIEALLTDHQKALAKAMQKRMHGGEESRQSAPTAESARS
jgi:Spy/CpxP family protein refolding chaperone